MLINIIQSAIAILFLAWAWFTDYYEGVVYRITSISFILISFLFRLVMFIYLESINDAILFVIISTSIFINFVCVKFVADKFITNNSSFGLGDVLLLVGISILVNSTFTLIVVINSYLIYIVDRKFFGFELFQNKKLGQKIYVPYILMGLLSCISYLYI